MTELAQFGSGGEENHQSWRQLYFQARRALGRDFEARLMVQQLAGKWGAEFWVSADQAAPPDALGLLGQMIERRLSHEPLAYVLGSWSFLGIEVAVGPGVIVPRPETEVTAWCAIERLRGMAGSRRLEIADLGTGSGAIALGLARFGGPVRVWAVELYDEAASWANRNLKSHPELASLIELRRGSWYEALPEELRGGLDLVVSNPPYVAASEVETLEPEVAVWEPREASVAGESGLEASLEVLGGAREWLREGGEVVLEVSADRAEETAEAARRAGLAVVETRVDLAGRPRVLVARRD